VYSIVSKLTHKFSELSSASYDIAWNSDEFGPDEALQKLLSMSDKLDEVVNMHIDLMFYFSIISKIHSEENKGNLPHGVDKYMKMPYDKLQEYANLAAGLTQWSCDNSDIDVGKWPEELSFMKEAIRLKDLENSSKDEEEVKSDDYDPFLDPEPDPEIVR